jgi:hypothetical protein
MDSSIRIVQIIRMALLGSIAMYIAVGEVVSKNLHLVPNRWMYYGFSGLTVVIAIVIVNLRRSFILQAQPALASKAADLNALNRWRTGFIVVYALSEAIALFGLILRVTGFTLSQAAPFYLAGIILLVSFGPRVPSDNIG